MLCEKNNITAKYLYNDPNVNKIGHNNNLLTVVPSMIRALFKNFPGKSGATQKIVLRGEGRC